MPMPGDTDNYHEQSVAETLIKAMEDCDNVDSIIVVYRFKNGDIKYTSNTVNIATKLGLLDLGREMIFRRSIKD